MERPIFSTMPCRTSDKSHGLYMNNLNMANKKHVINTEMQAKNKMLFKENLINKLQFVTQVWHSLTFFHICKSRRNNIEIKYPASIIGIIPTVENYPHLEVVYLIERGEYNFQIQG